MGTAHYLSPEQAQGRPVDSRSDLYSIGVMLYELLTGRVPFDAESPVSIAVQHVSEPPVPPSQVNPAVPPALEAVTLRAMAKRPEDRFQDADAFIAAVQEARDAPYEATAYAPAEVVEEVVDERDSRWWLWLLALLALLAIAAGLYLLLRPNQLVVPDVVGQRSGVAAQTLQNRGFEVNIQRVVNADVPDDRVVTENPRPGEKADKGSTVTIVVSQGPGQTTVPQVTGLRERVARRALRTAGLKVAVVRSFSADVASGHVVSATPPEGTTVQRGTQVRLTVSRGAQPVTVPDVTGKQVAEARGILEGKGLQVKEKEQVSSDKDPGTVLSQSPGSGSSLKPGGTVTLTVAKAPPQVSVPDVTGEPRDQARQDIHDAGLKVRSQPQSVDNPDQDGTVVDQSPAGGTSVDKGTRVTLKIGRFSPAAPEGGASPTPSPTASPSPSPTP
jgi:serine/threonine-protein kinase